MIEFGSPVHAYFHGVPQFAHRDANSGYVYFTPPPVDLLTQYYVDEYGKNASPKYYTLASDYDPDRCNHFATQVEGLARLFAMKSPLTVHELGCAYGGVVAELARRGHESFGSDVNSTAIALGRVQRHNDRIQVAAHGDAFEAGRRYDIIYGEHALEHDPALVRTLETSKRSLKDRGLLHFAVPNVMYVRAILEGLASHPWFHYPDHLHMLSSGYVLQLCDQLGFEPLIVATNANFQVDAVHVRSLFGQSYENTRVQETWAFMFSKLGLGIELAFTITPKGSVLAKEYAPMVTALRARLAGVVEFELAVRSFLQDLPASG